MNGTTDGTEGQPGAWLRDRKGMNDPIMENLEGAMGETARL